MVMSSCSSAERVVMRREVAGRQPVQVAGKAASVRFVRRRSIVLVQRRLAAGKRVSANAAPVQAHQGVHIA